MKKLQVLLLSLLIAFSYIINSFSVANFFSRVTNTLSHTVFADDDDDEDEEDEDEEDEDEEEDEHEEDHEDDEHEDRGEDDDDEYEYEDVFEYVYEDTTEALDEQEVLVPAPKVTYVWVYDAGYDVDTDGDGIVDAIDPHPTIVESLLFTDSDGDSVPDALDEVEGENDYFFHEDTDTNNNGILDSYEVE